MESPADGHACAMRLSRRRRRRPRLAAVAAISAGLAAAAGGALLAVRHHRRASSPFVMGTGPEAWRCVCGEPLRSVGTGRHQVHWARQAPESEPLLADACPACARELSSQRAHAV